MLPEKFRELSSSFDTLFALIETTIVHSKNTSLKSLDSAGDEDIPCKYP
jgi:hypothetical protein